jgi:hypothetical protein
MINIQLTLTNKKKLKKHFLNPVSFFLVLLLILIYNGENSLSAQELQDFERVEVSTADSYILNSVGRTNLANGKNRNSMAYRIPDKARFVVVSVVVDNSDITIDRKNYQSLMSRLSATANNSVILVAGSTVLSAMSPPATGNYCDFFILPDAENKKKFLDDGHPWKYDVEEISKIDNYTRLLTQSFLMVVDVKDLSDSNWLYLAFQNHGLKDGCRITIDVVAMIKKKKGLFR